VLKDKSFSVASYGSVLFLVLDDTRNLILNTLGNFADFALDIAKGIVGLIPSLIKVLKSTWKLIIVGIDVSTILLFLAPVLTAFYFMTYYIQLLNGNY
jgi:hypothetical protein